MILGNYSQGNIKRPGLITTLAAAMLVTLAACGGPATPPAQPVGTATQTAATSPLETVVGTPLGTAEATAPAALPTGTEGMGDMGDMEQASTTPTQAETGEGEEATATPAAGEGATGEATTEVQATLREWALDLSQQEVPAGKVVFQVTNAGQFTHNLAVEDSTGLIGKTPNFKSSDGVQTLELELAPGTYNVICSIPGHATRGQQNQLVVK